MAFKLVMASKNYSSWSLRAWLALEQTGAPFEEVLISTADPDWHAQIKRISPSGKVPLLIDDGLQIGDSLAIVEYLAEHHPGVWPADPVARAWARSAAAEMHSGFGALRSQLPMNVRRQPRLPHWDAAADADIARVQEIWHDLRMRSGNGGPFLCGDHFGIVDAMYAPVCVRFRGYGVPLDATSEAYLRAVFALPAMKEWEAAALAETERVASDEA